MNSVLVTGGNGFIGKYVQSRLRELGIEPIVYDVTRDIRDDVLDYERLVDRAGAEEVDGIIHLAGMLGTHELWDATDAAIDVNIKGALNVARAAIELDIKLVSIEQPHIWFNVYEATKFAARRMLTGLAYDQGLKVEFVTAHNAYGPGQAYGDGHPQKIIPTFATKAWLGEPIPIWGDGSQQVNLVYAGDVADSLVKCVRDPGGDPEMIWNAGSNRLVTVTNVAWLVAEHVGHGFKTVHYEMRKGEQPDRPYPLPDASYPYDFSEETLHATIDWYRPKEL